MTRAAFAAGLPAPEVFDEVTLEGRFGIVLSRLDGPTLLQLLRPRAMTPEQAGAILAALSISVHNTPPPPDVISLRDLIRALLRSPGNLLPKHLATGVLALLESLPPGDGLCHGDLHPGNVIMTAEGPRLIDWTWRKRAGPVLDLGHCHVVLCELIPEGYPARRQGSLRTLGALAFSGLGFGCAKTPAKVGSWVPDSGIARFDDMMTFDPSGHSTRRPTCGREARSSSLFWLPPRRLEQAPPLAIGLTPGHRLDLAPHATSSRPIRHIPALAHHFSSRYLIGEHIPIAGSIAERGAASERQCHQLGMDPLAMFRDP